MNQQWLPRMASLLAAALLVIAPGPAFAAFDHAHAAWTSLLQRHVVVIDGGRASRVDYRGFAADRAALGAYLAALSRVTGGEYAAWSREERLAFLINAYNAFTVEKVLTRYPGLRSMRDFGTIIGNPWKDRFFSLLGKPQHLDGIEHETIRAPGAFDDPRIHFAVNCAAVGCPMLREEAYVATRLERQLEEQTTRFLTDRARNRYADGRLELSRIFDWYRDDFFRGHRDITSVAQFIGRHAELLAESAADRAAVRGGKLPIRYLDYDWALNDVTR